MTAPERKPTLTSQIMNQEFDLIATLPEDMREVIHRLGRAFNDAGYALYLVGGSVRDLLLQDDVTDLDLTTDAYPEQTKTLGPVAGADSIYTMGEEFGTVGLVFRAITAEITTYRSEQYPTPDRRPVVSFGTDITEDLSRRDFTINAIAVDASSGHLVDPFEGVSDLDAATIRAVGHAAERFDEDPLRILRAARFTSQLNFRLNEETRAAMEQTAPQLERISVERIAVELNRLLVGRVPSAGLELLRVTGALPWTLPELIDIAEDTGEGHHKDIWEHTLQVVDQSPARLVVRWAALMHDAGKPKTRSVASDGEVHFFGHERVGAGMTRRAMHRLRQERSLTKSAAELVELHLRPSGYDETWTDSAVRRMMVEVGDLMHDLLDLTAADVTSKRAHRQRAAAQRGRKLRDHIQRIESEAALSELTSPLDGNALMAMFDRPPGKWIAEIKNELREMVIEGELQPGDSERAAEIARELVSRRDNVHDAE